MRLSPSRPIPRHRERNTPTSDLAADGPGSCVSTRSARLHWTGARSARLHWTSAFALGAAACGVHHHASDLAPSRACR